MCGKEFNEWDESFHTGNFDLFVGYGSKHDDERIQFSLCIDCFDRMMDTILPLFKINPIVDNSWTDHCTSDHLRHKNWGPGGKPYREDVTARIIVECGKNFADYGRLKEELDCVVTGYERAEIISGIEKGTDLFAEKYAKEKGIAFKGFPADGNKYGKDADCIRNSQMLEYANQEKPILVAFWDGKDKRTKDMITRAKDAGIIFKALYEPSQPGKGKEGKHGMFS